MRGGLCCFVLMLSLTAAADDSQRARYWYQMSCQGCHTPDGSGSRHVPAMKDHVGRFLNTQLGREYLVRVPGSATSALSDEQLAAVLNWILVSFSGESLPVMYEPFAPAEVERLRKEPLNEVVHYRAKLLAEIGSAGVAHPKNQIIGNVDDGNYRKESEE